jgi:acetolactate synthase-1/2/3 large subunit
MLGMHGARYTNILLEETDLIVVIGSRFDDRATGRVDKFCPSAQVIHIDTDASEVNKLRRTQIGIISDAGLALEALIPLLDPTDRSPWLARIAELRQSHAMAINGADDPCTPYGIIRSVASFIDETAIITSDVGQHQMRTAQAYPFVRTRQWLTSGGLGSMGFGLPAAIGASLANPESTVVCFTGDGSLLMNIQEMATAVEQKANVKIILCNNNALGLVQQLQELFFNGHIFGTKYSIAVDFPRIAEGFGIPAVNLCKSSDPMADLQKALQSKGPYLVEINAVAEDLVFPIVPPGASNSEMIGGDCHAK